MRWLLALLPALLFAAHTPDVPEIIAHSVQANQEDWKQAPGYSFIERDADSKHGGAKTIKTFQVLMIDGSPYNKLIAVNDEPISSWMLAEEDRKLQRVIAHRRDESERERRRRVAKYERERNQDHAMLNEMTKAFEYQLTGETTLNGRTVWVLKATPKPGYVPPNVETKMLTGMRGTMWVDQATYQWVKVEAEVFRPVSIFGLFARVGPGTRFELEQEPVNDTLWMPTRLKVNVKATALGFFDESSTEDDSFRNYRPMPQVLAELVGKK